MRRTADSASTSAASVGTADTVAHAVTDGDAGRDTVTGGYTVIALIAAVMLHWIVLNDIHLDPYDTGAAAERGEDTNPALFDASIAEMRRRVPDASVIIIGGDLLAHNFSALARRKHLDPNAAGVATMRGIASKLDKAFPNAQFLVAVGNNDDPCGDYHSEAGGSYNRAVAKIFAPLVNRHGASPGFVDGFTRGAYYTSTLPNNLKGVVANSVFWSFVFRGSCQPGVRDPGGKELKWLTQTLSRNENIVVMHMPLGFDPESTTTTHRILAVPFLHKRFDDSVRALFAKDREHLPFAIAGHTHRYDFRTPGGVPMLVASSLSPVYHNEPAFFRLDVDGQILRDVVPYTYDPSLGWVVQDSFDKMFDVDSFTTPELEKVSDRIANDGDVRKRWEQAYDVWGYYMGDVTAHRWETYRCAQIAFGDDYARCAGTYVRSVMNLALAAGGVFVFIVAGVLLFVTWRRATPSS